VREGVFGRASVFVFAIVCQSVVRDGK
jgi:hypothetical protein